MKNGSSPGKHYQVSFYLIISTLLMRYLSLLPFRSAKDTTVRLWSRSTLELAHVFIGHTAPVNAIDLSRTSKRIISASGDGTLILWDIRTRRLIRTLTGHSRGLACVAFVSSTTSTHAPHGFRRSATSGVDEEEEEDDELVISGSNDQTIRIWRASSGECVCLLEGHKDLVRALAYDPITQRFISASYDQTVILWQLKRTRKENSVARLGSNSADTDTLDDHRQEREEQGRSQQVVTADKLRQFKNYHTSNIFDAKFDVTRIIRSVATCLSLYLESLNARETGTDACCLHCSAPRMIAK